MLITGAKDFAGCHIRLSFPCEDLSQLPENHSGFTITVVDDNGVVRATDTERSMTITLWKINFYTHCGAILANQCQAQFIHLVSTRARALAWRPPAEARPIDHHTSKRRKQKNGVEDREAKVYLWSNDVGQVYRAAENG